MPVFVFIIVLAGSFLLGGGIREESTTAAWLGVCMYLILPTIYFARIKKVNSVVLRPYFALQDSAIYTVIKKVRVDDGSPPIYLVREVGNEALHVFQESKRVPKKFKWNEGANGPIGSWPPGFDEIE